VEIPELQVKLETGVPMPERKRVYSFLYKMGAGESAQCPATVNKGSLSATIGFIQRRDGKRFSRRTQADGTVRVWRIS